MIKKILLILLGLAALGIIIGVLRSRTAKEIPPAVVMEQVNQEDLQRLKTGSDEAEMAKSLRRMSYQDPAKAAGFARQWLNHESVTLRSAACETIGSFAEQSWDSSVAACLSSSDSMVRTATLKGLLRQPGENRRKLAEKHWLAAKTSTDEKLWAGMAVIFAMPESKERAGIEKNMLVLLEKATPALQSEILPELYKHWAGDPRLFLFAEKVLQRGTVTPDFFASFSYLSAYAPEKLGALLTTSAWPDSRYFLIEVNSFLAAKCPKDWPAIQKKISQHPKAEETLKSAPACAPK